MTEQRLSLTVVGCNTDVARRLRRAARAALSREGRRAGRVEIALVGGPEMARNHRRWLSQPGATDVLTFDLNDGGDRRSVDGLILVCADVARREAGLRGIDWRVEAALYVVHGCLHLCGYDDRTRGDFRRMHRREDEIMTALGWGAPFAGPARGPPRRFGAARTRKRRGSGS